MQKQPSYQSIARSFRPQMFSQVLGQNPIVTTLKNALLQQRLAHAYLFCGSKGSGKTTLARILAKALCCEQPKEVEPCGVCSNCIQIQAGQSLDVIEIDGASNRGIDDIRTLSETTNYAPSYAKWKIYIIDEVHMLTKEASNALLKTLEEPPLQVKFFFATTEPHKILPTILSRCQRFDLARIPIDLSIKKLEHIAQSLQRKVSQEALHLLANKAEGSLRDAESLLEQIFSYERNAIDAKTVINALGMSEKQDFIALDQACLNEDYSFAFSFVNRLVDQGKDLSYFLEQLFAHFRQHFLDLLEKKSVPYTKETLLWMFDAIRDTQNSFAQASYQKLALEMLLLQLIRAKKRVCLSALLSRLEDMHTSLQSASLEDCETQSKEKTSKKLANTNQVATSPEKIKKTVSLQETTKNPQELVKSTPEIQNNKPSLQKQVKQDTLLRFSAVVLEGRIEQN